MKTEHQRIPELSLIEENTSLPKVAGTGMKVSELSLNLSDRPVLQNISFTLHETGVTSIIGPSGAGKSTLLRCMNGLYQHWQGDILLQDRSVRRWPGGWDALRRHVGLIAQKPCVFPATIKANVTFGLSRKSRRNADGLIEACLRQAALWDEVKDRLDAPAESLSVGQQQRLCIARALAVKPAVLLLDEPTASLDPRSKQLIEQSIAELAADISVLCVTHDLMQTQRLGGQVIFICDGKVIEQGACESVLDHPQQLETREFLRWSVCECD